MSVQLTKIVKQEMVATTHYADEFLESLSAKLEIPDSRYETAERSYKSVGNWLCRDASTLKNAKPVVHIQGSFALGTVIRPILEDEEYDIDMIAELNVDIRSISQKQVKDALMYELAEYVKAYSMQEPEEHRRCGRLHYADGAQFHMDVTPAVPDGERQTAAFKSQNIPTQWSDLAVAITDQKHSNFAQINPDWPHSNPRGYLMWFQSRMATVFGQRRSAMALQQRKSVESIPDYQVRTPLQSAIQILKRHRDMTHDGDPADKPISIIITTLAAKAYNQETTVAAALYAILTRMELFIERKNGIAVVANPTDLNENFADKWKEKPEKETAFFSWLDKAKADFLAIAAATSVENAAETLSPVLGSKLVENAANAISAKQAKSIVKMWTVNNPAHKQPIPWTPATAGKVVIKTAEFKKKYGGFRWQTFVSGSQPLPKDADVRFEAITDVSMPYKVFWQVVNTGDEAANQNGLRGGFDAGEISQGRLARSESTRYRGTHSIECFIVKDNYCVASSGPFIVNIR